MSSDLKKENADGLRALGEAVARLASSEPGSEEWVDALERAEDAVDQLLHLEDTDDLLPGLVDGGGPPRVVTEAEHNALVNALAEVKIRLESTEPDTGE